MGPNPLTTLKGGVDNGLELLLDTQQDDYMPVWDETGKLRSKQGDTNTQASCGLGKAFCAARNSFSNFE